MKYVWVSHDSDQLDIVRHLFVEYQQELGVDLCFQGFSEELANLPGKYAAPEGALLLVFCDDEIAACGAIRDLGQHICEMKRLYVRPEFRRQGIAKTMSKALLEKAIELGYRTMRLDTLRRLTGAVQLYEELGFSETQPYNFNPEPDIVYMERELLLGGTDGG